MSESNNYYVSSRGLMKSCDFYSQTPASSINYLINYLESDFNKLKTINNPKIYVCSAAINDFRVRLLPAIQFPFILVSGDCDETMPYDVLSEKGFHELMANKYLVHWFCQNMVEIHPKITVMPIGMDYHTMTKRDVWGPIAPPVEQEKLLNSVKTVSKKQTMCYANFQFLMTTKYGNDRQTAIKEVPQDLVFYEPTRIPRLETWKKQSKFAFVISPHGNGLDCHRTWEALAIGCIPIVRTSKIDNLFEELPVLIVKEWHDITKELLENTIEEFKNKTFNMERLSLKYWIDKISTM